MRPFMTVNVRLGQTHCIIVNVRRIALPLDWGRCIVLVEALWRPCVTINVEVDALYYR